MSVPAKLSMLEPRPHRRVEDPARIVHLTERLAALSWKAQEQRESLRVLFECLSDLTHAEIRYYYDRRVSSRRLSRICRILAWLFGTAGVLVPVVATAWPRAPGNLLSLGYIAFALAGSALVADTAFAGSAAHQRYTKTQLALEQLYTLFAIEWQALIASLDISPGPERVAAAIRRAVAYCGALHEVLGAETDEWRTTMDKAREALNRLASTKEARSEIQS
jgi:hypothetical protein